MAMDSDYVKQMSTQLANYEVQSSLDRLNRNESNYKTQRDALSQLRTSLTTFKSALTKLNSSTSSMLVNSATYSQDGYATATVGTTAQPGSYQFYVEQLASKQQVAVQGLTDGSLSGTLTLNAQTFDRAATPRSTTPPRPSTTPASACRRRWYAATVRSIWCSPAKRAARPTPSPSA